MYYYRLVCCVGSASACCEAGPSSILDSAELEIMGKQAVLWIRIRDPGLGVFLTPGSGIRDGRKSASGSGIRDEQPGSYFLELRNHFFAFLGLKYLNSLMRIRDPGSRMETVRIRDPGSGMEKSQIRDPG